MKNNKINLKLVIGIAFAVILISVLTFGSSFTGFSILSFVGIESKGQVILKQVLDENKEIAAKLTDYDKTKLNKMIAENPDYSKEDLDGIVESMTRSEEEIAEIQREAEEATRNGPPAVGAYEESFVIGGKTYSEKELQQMNQEQIDEIIKQKQDEANNKWKK